MTQAENGTGDPRREPVSHPDVEPAYRAPARREGTLSTTAKIVLGAIGALLLAHLFFGLGFIMGHVSAGAGQSSNQHFGPGNHGYGQGGGYGYGQGGGYRERGPDFGQRNQDLGQGTQPGQGSDPVSPPSPAAPSGTPGT